MKKTLKNTGKVLGGIADGSIGLEFLDLMDKNGDGKISWKEIKSLTIRQWIKVATSLGTTIFTVKTLLGF